MALKRMNKLAATALTAVMVAEAGLTSFVPLTVEAKEQAEVAVEEAVVNASADDNFTWDNATVYFVITDRFENGDTTNDHSYGRSEGEVNAAGYGSRIGTFHGGDLAGMTKKIEEGYFDDLGVNAIWITAPYEQIHGAICSEGFKHYAYHGYYALDFSNMDANMGTEEDMRKFVDTAHAHGIRVVLDIVLNHVGYADPVTANEYGFGKLGPDWENIYYKTSESDYHWYHDYSSETTDGKYTMDSSGNWAGWWGPSWIRAVSKRFSGYEGSEDGSDLTLCTGGLPDIKTESSNDNGIPPVLKTKWQKEGRYDTEVAELKQFFSDNGLQPTNANYVIKWLTDFVRDYGVDGFRCDTAKHVEKSNWGTLSKCGTKALQEWREKRKTENPDDPAAYWDEEFWTTGEAWGHGVGKDDYYTTGGFDSMINFSFQGNETKSGAALESVYADYASQINSDPTFNVLSYISSHDKGLGARSANAGTALLLCPGGVQIYYGDETGRDSGGVSGEQGWRSHMNWNSIKTDIQSNWQKVGSFRRDHASVGAGQHAKLSDSPYTFSRTYNLGEENEDKVVVSLPGTAGTHDVSVGDIFADGETITDAYSGEEYTVSGGSVSVTCDSNGVILLEGSGEVKPTINGKIVSGKLPYTTETIDIKLSATKATDTYYSVNGGEKVAYTDGTTITIGGGAAYDEVTTVTLTGTGEDGSALTKELTYMKCSEPSVSDGTFTIKVSKSEFPTAPHVYLYKDKIEPAGAWPGTQLTQDDNSEYWSYSNDEITDAMNMILVLDATSNTPGGWRSEKSNASGGMLYSKASDSYSELPADTPAKVVVNYVNEAGAVLKSVYRVGAVGKTYETSAATIPGCTLKETPANATGTFTEKEITVTYVYSGGGDVKPTVTKAATPTPPADVTNTPIPTPPADVTNTPTPTQEADPTNTPVPTQLQGATNTPTPTNKPEDKELEIEGFTVTNTEVNGAKGVKLTAYMLGDSGKKVRYMYTYEKDGKEFLIENFQSESSITWIPTSTGKYKFNLYVIYNGNILSTNYTYTVR